jgi:hypothetical protein
MIGAPKCVFFRDSLCEYFGGKCGPCKNPLPQIAGLTYRDHFDVFERRRVQREERNLKLATIGVSVLALCVSFATLFWQIGASISNARRPTNAQSAASESPGPFVEEEALQGSQ